MQKVLVSVFLIQASFVKGFLFNNFMDLNVTCTTEKLPCLDVNAWWGPLPLKGLQDERIRPFKIQFDDEMIADLRYRLRDHRRFIPPLQGVSFQYGFNTRVLEDWAQYWADEYPFKERERFLNKYPMYKTNIQGLDMFFIWVKPKVPPGKHLVPLLLIHGWPGSVREFYEAIPKLTAVEDDRDFVLELIIPSLPGFGYSDSAVRPGLGAGEAAVILRNLMNRLGYKKYYVQGGDLGTITGNYLATMFPKEVLGFHTNWPLILHPTARIMHILASVYPPLVVDPSLAYRLYPLSLIFYWLTLETGYLHHQATKPDTLGVAISDSPSGLMAYNLYHFNLVLGTLYTDDLDSLPRDNIIDHLMFYWAPNSITTAFRYYAETFNLRHVRQGLDLIPLQVPVWVIQAEYEATYDPPSMMKVKFPLLVNETILTFGGHLLAFETPGVFADSVLKAVEGFRHFRRHGKNPALLLQDSPKSLNTNNKANMWKLISSTFRASDVKTFLNIVFKFTLDAVLRLVKRVFNNDVFNNFVSIFKYISMKG